MKITKKMKFERVSGFYPDLSGLVKNNSDFERKSLPISELAKTEDGYVATLSSNKVDADGDIVLSSGINLDYYTGVLIWNHNLNELPIGKCDEIAIGEQSTSGVLRFAKNYAFAEDILNLVDQGMLKGVSIGYIPKQVAHRGTQAFIDVVNKYKLTNLDGCKRILVSVELIEVSVVPVGCNREAMIHAIVNKSFKPTTATNHEFGLDNPDTKMLIALSTKVLDMETAFKLTEAPDASDLAKTEVTEVLGTLEEVKSDENAVPSDVETFIVLLDEAVERAISKVVATLNSKTDGDEANEDVEVKTDGDEVDEDVEVKTDGDEVDEDVETKRPPLQFKILRNGGITVDEEVIKTKANKIVCGRVI